MKKSTLILIAIAYIASIVIISMFGMRAIIYNEVIPVTKVECLNQTDEKTKVTIGKDGIKTISVLYDQPGDPNTLTGTMIQLDWRVSPDNATKKGVTFIYDETQKNITFVKDKSGNDLGLILFSGPVAPTKIRIMATDGSRVYTEVRIWAKY